MIGLVPPYMPWRLLWIYFIGVALIVAALSIATRIQVRWSGLLFANHDVPLCGDDSSSGSG